DDPREWVYSEGMKRSDHVEIPAHVMIREVGGECVVLDLETEKYFGLDDVGTDILRAFRSGKDVGETVDVIVSSYDVAEETVLSDLGSLVQDLVARGLARVVDNG